MADNRLRVWWLTSEDYRAIGDPYDTSDPDEEPEAIEEGQASSASVDLANMPWPEYVKKQYRLLFGRAPKGHLFVADELLPGAAGLFAMEFQDPRLMARCQSAHGIVILRNDASYVLPYGGFMTDELGRYSA